LLGRYLTACRRQVLGSTMHDVAGDCVDILAGEGIAGFFRRSNLADISLHCQFNVGWHMSEAVFQF